MTKCNDFFLSLAMQATQFFYICFLLTDGELGYIKELFLKMSNLFISRGELQPVASLKTLLCVTLFPNHRKKFLMYANMGKSTAQPVARCCQESNFKKERK